VNRIKVQLPAAKDFPRDLMLTGLNVALGGGLVFRFAMHTLLSALLIDEPLTERVTATNMGATLRLGVETGLSASDRMLVRCGSVAILSLMAVHLLRASVVTNKFGTMFLGLQMVVIVSDPIQEVLVNVIQR